MNPIVEAEHLKMAERHVAEAKRLIADQEERVARLEATGVGDQGRSLDFLQAMRAVLANAENHRDFIRQMLQNSKSAES